ncbi:hypothetical protein [Aureimonas sp. Leaf454]|uniref:hypothetical protein n=1 Tax=Aureimonas sp. Leaf454 TaxID=1736381 RepID=UPI000AE5C683|nr:hypothetical protein [Aureimonas sp. Leaf454]
MLTGGFWLQLLWFGALREWGRRTETPSERLASARGFIIGLTICVVFWGFVGWLIFG